jgi:hypothetical protein
LILACTESPLRVREKGFLTLIEFSTLNLVRTGEYYYELFKLNRDSTGDIHKCMAYLNKAIECVPSEWVYLFEMSLFIKQVTIFNFIRVGFQTQIGCSSLDEESA